MEPAALKIALVLEMVGDARNAYVESPSVLGIKDAAFDSFTIMFRKAPEELKFCW